MVRHSVERISLVRTVHQPEYDDVEDDDDDYDNMMMMIMTT